MAASAFANAAPGYQTDCVPLHEQSISSAASTILRVVLLSGSRGKISNARLCRTLPFRSRTAYLNQQHDRPGPLRPPSSLRASAVKNERGRRPQKSIHLQDGRGGRLRFDRPRSNEYFHHWRDSGRVVEIGLETVGSSHVACSISPESC